MATDASLAPWVSRPSGDPCALARSYAYCEKLARREAGNFYHAFRVLPNRQRRAMCALYAFCRIADDLSDGPGLLSEKRTALLVWRNDLRLAMSGRYAHPLHAAFHHTVKSYRIPLAYIEAVLDGVEMDLEPVAYVSISQLERYCYRVASAVGLACIHSWGFAGPRALELAEKAGIAFQLTNILRDLGEDAARGRVYLPSEDLERFGYSAESLRRGERNETFRALMRFQVERARSFYEAAGPLSEFLEPPGRAIFWILTRTYRGLLDAIESRDYDVFSSRVRVSTWRKLFLAVRALPYRWGWT
jgi:phytoene synthase